MFTTTSNSSNFMKTSIKSIFLTALTGLLLTSCAKNDDFSVPTLNCENPEVHPNKTIEEIYQVSTRDVVPYTGNQTDVIKGVVVSSDKGGNFHNKLYIVDEKTQMPAIISIDNSASFVQFPPGTIVYVKLGGLYFNTSFDLLNIGGGIYTSAGGSKYTAAIPKGAIAKYMGKFCEPVKDLSVYNNVITLAQLKENIKSYKGKLVTIKDVQFERDLIGKKLYDASDVDSQGQTLRGMVDAKGNKFFVRTSQYSRDFIDYLIPTNSGTITGIADEFNNTIQFYPRVIEDIKLTEQPFGNGTEEPTDPEDGEVKPGKFLAFPGADFEDWNAFLGVIFKNALSDATAKKADGKGWENSRGLAIEGTRSSNGFLFSVENVKTPTNATKLSFLVKGTSAKSLSINVYKANGTNYHAYNVENLTTSKTIQPNTTETSYNGVPSGNTTNVYTGTIDTKGKWVKVTLDLGALAGDYHKAGTGTFIGFRSGNNANYDLVIDDIRFEDGTPVDNETPVDPDPVDPDPVDPVSPDMVADFNDWNSFVGSLSTHGLKSYATHAPGEGRNGKDAMKINGNITANEFVFTITNKQVPSDKTKLVIWVKGTSDAKSLSFNVYKATAYDPFNTGTIGTANLDLVKAANNQYTGTIDTNNQWVKITLDLTSTQYNASGTGDVFAIKTGKDSTYNLLIDSIYFE